jgi:hypothetical protein
MSRKITEYEYIQIEEIEQRGKKTSVFPIFSKSSGEHLGTIKWYGPWRQYCFYPLDETIWNDGCLKDVTAFLIGLKLGRKLKKIEHAHVCMNCLNVNEVTKDDVWLLRRADEAVCIKCNSKDMRVFHYGKQIHPEVEE